ncbi:EAL domain-containing protein [Sulfuricurvum sp.]|uniref:sensor domain-containing protein n=1 Tax=Sulfuricurvum sp. TaxID=2025608 RepID=UPI0035699BDD
MQNSLLLKNVSEWFEHWMMPLPVPVIITDQDLKVQRINEKAKSVCHVNDFQPNYLENHFKPVFLPMLLNFKAQLSQQFYAQVDLKLDGIGESRLIGHRFEGDKPFFMIIIFPDFYKERYNALNSKLHLLLEHFNAGVLITDRDYKIIEVNTAFKKMTGFDAEDVIGKMPSILKSGKQGVDFYKKMHADIHEKGIFQDELVDRTKSGELIQVRSTIFPLQNDYKDVTNYVGILEDITELKFLRTKLLSTSFKDPLTGVYNRESFLNVLEIKIDVASEENQIALLFIDLNKFKQVNDTYGHQYGDLVLSKAANRIKKILRSNDMIGRYGGDEFLILLERINEETAKAIAQKIDEALSRPYEVDEQIIDFTSASIGIALAPRDAKKMSELIERADAAMYEAKKSSHSSRVFMAKDFIVDKAKDKSIRTELLSAVGGEEFFIRIQPIIDMETTKVVGGEVLARWLNLTFNNVRPDIFFALAEKLGVEKKIDSHILSLTVDFLQNNPLDEAIFINVNFSGNQFGDIHLIDNMRALLEATPALKNHLVVEITEHVMMKNMELTSEYLYALREMGIRIAIDDFGTGFSSLAYLKHFEIDFLKIDISFIQQIEDNHKDREIVQTIVTLANAIGAKTIVEGIERLTQYEILKKMGATYAQGFYFDKPLYPNQFYKRLG